jgi:sigma-B regulation protein RsbU (phosphoserine phosphatase)
MPTETPDDTTMRAVDDRLSPDSILAQVKKILSGPDFVNSERLNRFLRFVVIEALGGRAERLKEYAIALEVFDRDETFDSRTSPIVRVEAGRLRRLLKQYYLTFGRDDQIHIEIPKGGYVPKFRLNRAGTRSGEPHQADRPSQGSMDERIAKLDPRRGRTSRDNAPATGISGPQDGAHPSTILVVDDEPEVEALVLQRFRKRIRQGDLAFLFAHDGEDALEVLLAAPEVDVVLTDIAMPRMDGLTLLDHLSELNPSLVRVVVSAYGDMRNIRIAMNRGAFDFLTKPINFEDLTITVDKSLAHLKILREAAEEHAQLVDLRKELAIARQIQRSILPSEFPENERFSVHAETMPAREIGGDFFDVFPMASDRCSIVIAEVPGRGVPAALCMAMLGAVVKTTTLTGLSPRDCATKVNEILCRQIALDIPVRLFLAVFDPASGAFQYVNAGHHEPYILRDDGGVQPLSGKLGPVVGIHPDADYPQSEINLEPGESIFLYTGGMISVFDTKHHQFSVQRLEETLQNSNALPARKLTETVMAAVSSFIEDAPQTKDISCLALTRSA